MYSLLLRLLFILPPEKAHYFTLNVLQFIHQLPFGKLLLEHLFINKKYQQAKEVMGLQFKNCVGLAAGFDKNAKYIDALASIGFGFIEIGTVTPLPQAGNPQPRLFRLPKDKAIINRMGFNNDGVDIIVERLKHRKSNIIIGGNIGKNKITPNEEAVNDYVICFNKLFDYVDYFVVNVSSPNTPNLRALQEKDSLLEILQSLQNINQSKSNSKPILLKIAPDLSPEQLNDIAEVVKETNIDGVIANNTTISRENLKTPAQEIKKIGNGGLSGPILRKRSNEVLRHVVQQIGKEKCIIGVGGISNGKSAKEKLEIGADLVQIYTGFIYKGPGLIKEILKNQ